MEGMTIRAERPADADAIAAVVRAAFDSPLEAALPAAIRASPNFVADWSLVAEVDGRIVGHVMVSYVTLRDGNTERRIPSLAPLSVAPDVHGRGIGSALVEAVVRRVDEAGAPLVILEGAPAYYGRLGFEYAVPHGIRIALPEWAPAEAAQVRRLHTYLPTFRGDVVYPPAFGILGHDDSG